MLKHLENNIKSIHHHDEIILRKGLGQLVG